MIPARKVELPSHLRHAFEKAVRLEWLTLGYLVSVVLVMYLVMGNSQAMKAAWLEDLLSIVPCIAFLVASRFYDKPPNSQFPYGYHRVFTIAFLCGAVALFAMGVFLLIDSGIALLSGEHPTIGGFIIDGEVYWKGYLMYGALIYSAVPSFLLGRKKLPLARKLHNKVLHTDADAQKADWMTAVAAMVGITGIGLGWWWADGVAAMLIAVNVVRDGYRNLANAATDLLDRKPKSVDLKSDDPLLEKIAALLARQPWITSAGFRMREQGQVFYGEVFVVPKAELENPINQSAQLQADLQNLHWKIQEVTISLVNQIPAAKNQPKSPQ